MAYDLFINCTFDEHLVCVQFFTVVNSAGTNTCFSPSTCYYVKLIS